MCSRVLCLGGVLVLVLTVPVTAHRLHPAGGRQVLHAEGPGSVPMSRTEARQRLTALAELPPMPSASVQVRSSVLCFCLAKAGETLRGIRHRARQHFNEGVAAMQAHQYEKAIAAFSRAIVLNPQDARGYAHRGFVYGLSGQYREALRDLSRALTLGPHPVIYYLRGLIYVLLGKTEHARADLVRAAQAGYTPARGLPASQKH